MTYDGKENWTQVCDIKVFYVLDEQWRKDNKMKLLITNVQNTGWGIQNVIS